MADKELIVTVEMIRQIRERAELIRVPGYAPFNPPEEKPFWLNASIINNEWMLAVPLNPPEEKPVDIMAETRRILG